MNTKPIIGWIAVALCLCAWRPTAANPRIAVVNIEALVRAHPRTVADKTHLEETLRGYEAEGDRLREQIDALRATFERVRAEAEDSALSPQARQRAATAADEARQSWVEARDDWHEQMQRMQQRLTEQELRLLNRTFSELRREIGDYAEAEALGWCWMPLSAAWGGALA